MFMLAIADAHVPGLGLRASGFPSAQLPPCRSDQPAGAGNRANPCCAAIRGPIPL